MTGLIRRRRVIGGGLAALALYGAFPRVTSAGNTRVPLGLQLFSLDAEMKRDLPGTLRAVRAMGYGEVELVGYYGLAPVALRAHLRAASLDCKSIHIRPQGTPGGLPGLAEDPERHFTLARELGVEYIVCPGPWFPESIARTLPTSNISLADIVAAVDRMTDEDWRASALLINQCGEGARRRGLQLLYHNGNFEFVRRGSTTGFDTLLRGFDFDVVRLELDCGWVMAAGHDPISYLKENAGRVPLVHLKDMTATPANTQMALNPAQIGEGIVEWPTLMSALQATGVTLAYIEQEAPFARPALDYARNNLRFLNQLR